MNINGTLIWYYEICKREVWLMNRNILPDQKDANVDIGRFIHKNSYSKNKKEIEFGNVKFDVLMHSKDTMIIGETKKSSRFEDASRMQLLFYLKVLKESGIDSKGVLLYPEEKRQVEVELNNETRLQLDEIEKEITEILKMDSPPSVSKNRYCRSCAYREYCYA